MLHNDDKFLLVALELLQTSTNICVKIWSDRKRPYQKRITMTNSSLRDFFFSLLVAFFLHMGDILYFWISNNDFH